MWITISFIRKFYYLFCKVKSYFDNGLLITGHEVNLGSDTDNCFIEIRKEAYPSHTYLLPITLKNCVIHGLTRNIIINKTNRWMVVFWIDTKINGTMLPFNFSFLKPV